MRGYLDLMKLRVVELLLVSTLPAMVLAAEGLPQFGLAFATIFAHLAAFAAAETSPGTGIELTSGFNVQMKLNPEN